MGALKHILGKATQLIWFLCYHERQCEALEPGACLMAEASAVVSRLGLRRKKRHEVLQLSIIVHKLIQEHEVVYLCTA